MFDCFGKRLRAEPEEKEVVGEVVEMVGNEGGVLDEGFPCFANGGELDDGFDR